MNAGHKTLDLQELLNSKSKNPWPLGNANVSRHSLVAALRDRTTSIAIIGECRRFAPSYGQASKYSVNELLNFYSAHVDAINVLTDNIQFGGDLRWLQLAKESSNLPVICLDFVSTEQAIESVRSFGADVVILIASLLSPAKLVALCTRARSYGLETIVEIQNEQEAKAALEARADIVGVNTRKIDQLSKVDLSLPERIIASLPPGTLTIVESGLRSPGDLKRYKGIAEGVLIGSAFVESDNLAQTFADFDAVR